MKTILNFKKIITIIFILAVLIILSGLLIKLFYYDPVIKKKRMMRVIKKYYEKNEFDTAKKFSENLLNSNPNDPELLDLLDKIIEAENEQVKFEKELRDRQMELIIQLLRAKNSQPIYVKTNYPDYNEQVKYKYSNKEYQDKQINPDVEILIHEGIEAFNNEDYNTAKNKFSTALKIDKEHPLANAYLGAVLFVINPEDDENIEKIAKLCKKAIKDDETIEIAHLTLGGIYYLKNLKESAVNEYKKTLELNPNSYNACFEIGKIFLDNKDYDNAINYFSNSIKIKNDFITGYFYLANTYYEINDMLNAEFSYLKVLSLDKDFYHAYAKLGDIYFKSKKYDDSSKYYLKALAIEKNYIYYYRLAESYIFLDRPDHAVPNLYESIKLNPKISNNDKKLAIDSYEKIINIKFEKKNYNEAISDLKKVLILSPGSPDFYYLSAYAKNKSGKDEEAIEDYLKTIKINSNHLNSYIELSSLYNKKSKYKTAINLIEPVIENFNNDKLLQHLADSYKGLKKYNTAIVYYSRSIDNNSSCYDSYYELGEIYFKQNNYKKAKLYFNSLLKINPDYYRNKKIEQMLSKIGGRT